MATVKIKNTSSYDRTGVVTLGIPFSRGFNLQSTDTLVVSNALTGYTDQKVQWYPQGARWDTGAVKYARASFKTDLTSGQEKTATVLRSNNYTGIPFSINPSLITGFLGTLFEFTIQGRTFAIPMINVALNLIEGGGTNDHYARYRYFTHLPDVGTDPQYKYIWVDLMVETHSLSNTLEFYFRFGYYRFYPTLPNASGVDPKLSLVSPVTLRISGPRSKIRWEEYKIPGISNVSTTNRVYTLINPSVLGKNSLVAGQSHCYKGVLVFDSSTTSSADLDSQILAMAVDWNSFYPITGVLPTNPSYITSSSDALNRSNTLLNYMQNPVKNITDPYNWPTICNNPNTSDAGAHGQRDYAYGLRGWPILSTTNYNWIPFLEFCTRQQAVRNNWFYSTSGTPITPTELRQAGVRIWNGTYFFSNNGETFCGFNRTLGDWDAPKAAPYGQAIWGPDKEHFTNKMFILQGFITMDWFSLEYAKMYSKYWIYANRTDNYGSYPSAISTFGTARAAGRVSEIAAFLYEFYADSELKQWVKTRLDYNLTQPFTQLVNKTANPGGTEVIRAISIQDPCGQAACLNSLQHWRPWEEAQAVLGFYLLSKAILTETPTDTHGLRMREIARDIAASVLLFGYVDGRPGSATRRFITLSFPTTAAKAAFEAGVGAVSNNIVATGLTSGANGTIYLYHTDFDTGSVSSTMLRLYLKNATGTFVAGEQVRIFTGHQGQVHVIYPFSGGCKSRAVQSPSAGYARNLTTSEEEALTYPGEDPNYAPPGFPVGYLKYNYHYYLYSLNQIQSAVVAREAASASYYTNNNSTIITKANDLLNYFNTSGYNTDNGDFEESFLCFAGYLVQNLINTSQLYVNADVMTGSSSMPSVSITIDNPEISATVSAGATNAACESRGAIATGTTVANAVVSAATTMAAASGSQGAGKGGAIVVSSYTNAVLENQIIDSVFTTNIVPGRIVHTYIRFGTLDETEVPTDDIEVSNTVSPMDSGILFE
jgi:hypothetical protein